MVGDGPPNQFVCVLSAATGRMFGSVSRLVLEIESQFGGASAATISYWRLRDFPDGTVPTGGPTPELFLDDRGRPQIVTEKVQVTRFRLAHRRWSLGPWSGMERGALPALVFPDPALEPQDGGAARMDTVGDDRGGGSSWCSRCHRDLTGVTRPEACPGCGRAMEPGTVTPYPFGGSDF